MRRFSGEFLVGVILAVLFSTTFAGTASAHAALGTGAAQRSTSAAACGYEDGGDYFINNPAGTVVVGQMTIWFNTCNNSIHTQVIAHQPSFAVNAYIGNGSIASAGNCYHCTRVDTKTEIPLVRGSSIASADIYLCDGCEDNTGYVRF